MSAPPVPFATRVWFAYACFFRVLFDGSFAARAWLVREELPTAPEPRQLPPEAPAVSAKKPPQQTQPDDSALRLLALLQSSGRFLDFLEEDVTPFSDADLGAAARVVHSGCRECVRRHAPLAPVRTEDEGAVVTVDKGYDATAIKLTGNVRGDGPWNGALRHRGWRTEKVALPELLPGVDPRVLAPAEVEL